MRCKRILVKFLAVFVTIFTFVPHTFASDAGSILENAQSLKGTPYAYGGTTTSGFDCSGYTQYVYKQSGVSLPRTTSSQFSSGDKVTKSELKQGDLVFFNTSGSGVSHVGIYIGNAKFIHAATNYGVKVSSINDPYYWGSRYIGARRILAEEKTEQKELPVAISSVSTEATASAQ